MKIGLVGLPGSGKTTCFGILSGRAPADTHHGATLASVPLPDPRLDRLLETESPKKLVYADVTFIDFDALHKGEAKKGELALHKIAGDADAFALVVQAFGDLDHLGNALDPASDLETLMLEMALSDLSIISRALERLSTAPKSERVPQEIDLLERCRAHLDEGRALRDLSLSPEALKQLSGFAPLTLKPLLVVLNVGDDDLQGASAAGAAALAQEAELCCITLCAALEHEIAELSPEDQQEFLADYHLDAPARERFLHAAFEMLNLVTFYTVNDKEARAWHVGKGSLAPQAAGKVHSDMQAGFIRAEVVPFSAVDKLGSIHAAKAAGYQRVEGKEYEVRDGDILQIRFSH